MIQCDTLESGLLLYAVVEFRRQTICKENPIILKEFANSKYCLIHDNILGHDVIVKLRTECLGVKTVMLMTVDM